MRWMPLEVGVATKQWRCVFSDLNEELLVEILLRLPFKSFIQFQCVCKRWRILISELKYVIKKPWAFTCLSSSNSFQKLEFLAGSACHTYKNPLFKTELPFLHREDLQKQKSVIIESSFNDLILCNVWQPRIQTYCIFNPLTKHYMVLPPAPRSDYGCFRCTLICEPYSEYKKDGDNYHAMYDKISSNCRFRVVRIERTIIPPYDELEVQMYSSETGLWSEHVVSCPKSLSHPSEFPMQRREFVEKVVVGSGQIFVFGGVRGEISSVVMFDPFIVTSNNIFSGHLLHLPCDIERWNWMVHCCLDRVLSCKTLYSSKVSVATLSVWELEMEVAKAKLCQNPWRLIHRIPLSKMEPGFTPTEDHLTEWRKEVFNGEADPYSWKYRSSWIANFLKIAVEIPKKKSRYSFYVNCVGFHPFDANVILLLLCFYRTPDHNTPCLASYNMHTKAIKAIQEDQLPDIFHRFIVLHNYGSRGLFPVVVQPWPTLI